MRLQPVLDHDSVTAPCQGRSQRTLERILEALTGLLAERSFDQISMAELAERAGCSVTSIYARFKDKWSMIAAAHESFLAEARGRIDTFLAPEKWKGAGADAILAATATELVDSYFEQRHLMRAVLFTDEPVVYGRALSVERYAAEALLKVLPKPPGLAAAAFHDRVHFAVRMTLAVLVQTVLFDPCTKPRSRRTETQLAATLAEVMTSYIEGPVRERKPAAARTKGRGK